MFYELLFIFFAIGTIFSVICYDNCFTNELNLTKCVHNCNIKYSHAHGKIIEYKLD